MRRLLACVLVACAPLAAAQALKPLQVTPEELRWAPLAAGAYQSGLQQAVIVGDPEKEGTYVIRVKIPAGFRIAPHTHPDDRVVTVLSGMLLMGYGEQFDESRLKALGAGSVWTEPAGQAHFVWARDGEVVVEAVGKGPSAVTAVRR